MSREPSILRRIGRFLVISAGLKALLFGAAYLLTASLQQASVSAALM